jgi:hypothetical protein
MRTSSISSGKPNTPVRELSVEGRVGDYAGAIGPAFCDSVDIRNKF